LSVRTIPQFRSVDLDSDWQNFLIELQTDAEGFELGDIPWDELRIPEDPKMFKGRDEFIELLTTHLKSKNRARTYILVGLTRTGKSSILRYLAKQINLQPVEVKGHSYRFACFIWDFAKASAETNAGDMWSYFLAKQIIFEMEKWAEQGRIPIEDIPQLMSNKIRFKDWNLIIDVLHERGFFPVFLIDEFSHYRNLVEKNRIDSSFLAKIRSDALEDRASYVFAGTYDLKRLIQDPAFGITGQLVNATQKPVSNISEGAAIELIEVMEPKLTFTVSAKEYILHLSGQIPYFIQLICNRCAHYAYYNARNFMGPDEVDRVVRALIGESEDAYINPIDSSIFMNNMIMLGDPPEFGALLTTICHHTRGEQYPRFVTYAEIRATWETHGITQYQRRLANATRELKNRDILIEIDDEGQPAYRISVDLFRRWWTNEYRYLEMVLDGIKQED
jgi:hypothetical protein